jgi:hypothetical protein
MERERESHARLRPGHWLVDADGHPWLVVEVQGDLAVVEGRSTREAVALGDDGRIADDNGRGFGDPVEELLPETLDEFFPPPDSRA